MIVAAVGCAAGVAGQQENRPHAGMLRYPDVSDSEIVFLYANDLWIVSRDGGQARPLASPSGSEAFPKFSPDGDEVVFLGNYDGGRDLYTMSTMGGLPERISHRPGSEAPTDWHEEHGILFFTTADRDGISSPRVYRVGEDGGLPEQIDVPYGGNATAHEDGDWIAYTPFYRDTRTWKRYRGGMAADIWLFNLETNESRQVTDWEGTDTIPMWHGDMLYYLSDAGGEHRLNIWSYDMASGQKEQVTDFANYDVKFPSIGPGPNGQGEIVFQLGSELRLLDLGSGRSRAVEVTVPGAKPKIRPHMVDAGENLSGGGISSTGKRAVVSARGDIWTVPAENGPTRQITDSSGSAERSPAWSPDGRWIAYFSDQDGEYELYVTQSDGRGETRQVTDGHENYFFAIYWAPNSESVIVVDKAGRLLLTDIESGEMEEIDRDPWGTQPGVNWSKDSRWITWSRAEENGSNSAVWVYDTENGEKHRVTSGFFNDSSPVFSRDGDYMYYASNRRFESPMYEDVGTSFVYANTGKLIAVPLREDVENPWLVESDEEEWEEEADDAEENAEDSEEDGDDQAEDGEGDAEEETPAHLEGLDLDHPLHGTWNGTAKGLAALGLPDDELEFTMKIIVDEEGNVMGTSTSQGETNSLGDVVRWDEGSMELYRERQQGPLKTVNVGTVNGDSMTGTWTITGVIEGNGTWTAERVSTEFDEDEISEIKEESGGSGEDGDEEPVEIDIEGFEARGMELPVSAGNFFNLATNSSGELLYVRSGPGAPPSIKLIDATDDEPEEKNVLTGAGGFEVSSDGKKLIAGGAQGFVIVDAKPGQSFSNTLSQAGMRKMVDPRKEWEQLFTDAWRRHRDFFYVENMHGVDWDGVYDQYHAMLADAASREDVSFIIGEMISELNVGHAYYFGGDTEGEPSESVGLLGADFELETVTDEETGEGKTAYKIAKIYEGAPWDSDARGPLSQPGMDIEEGDYITHVNGVPLDTSRDPWAAFVGLTGQETAITFASALFGEEEEIDERTYVITPMGNEFNLRYRDWVEDQRAYVEEQSDGKVGYIHVPNTGVQGQNELFRQFYGQTGKDALIIDERWNGGGQIPTRFIELLNRPRTNYWARRDGKDWPWPPDSHQGPKVMLINGMSGSGGDMFPWLFKHNELGKLIGSRTWGGLVGISGVPGLIDGGYTAVPTFGFYETDGTWGIEGHGVDPDIAVVDDPARYARGERPQLDEAIDLMLEEIEKNGYARPKRPSDPVRRGIGIEDDDR